MNDNVTVLFASMTGNARDCGEKVAAELNKAGITTEAHDLASWDPRQLLEQTKVLITISTWGEGEPPDDGVNFYDYVKSLEAPALENIKFAVFALGDTSYDEFCKCGRDLDEMFEARGAQRLLDRVDNDIDFDDAFSSWCEAIVGVFQEQVPA